MLEVIRILSLLLWVAAPTDGDSPTDLTQEAPEVGAEEYLLRYQLEDDQRLRYEYNQTIHQTTAIAGRQKEEVASTYQLRRFSVGKFTDNAAEATLQFERVRMSLQVNGGKVEVGDSNMQPQELPTIFRPAFKNLNQAAKDVLIRRDGTPLDDEQVEAADYASFMIPLPEEPVKIGDSWTSHLVAKARVSEGTFASIKLLRSFKLKSVEDGVATISIANSYLSPVKSPVIRSQLLFMANTGLVKFDIEKGIVTRKILKFDNTVLGYMGPNTLATAKGKTVEVLLDQPVEVSAR